MGDSGRRSSRARKVSQRISTVSLAERENAKNARLDALENDDATGEGVVGDSDEEFVIQGSDEGDAVLHCIALSNLNMISADATTHSMMSSLVGSFSQLCLCPEI